MFSSVDSDGAHAKNNIDIVAGMKGENIFQNPIALEHHSKRLLGKQIDIDIKSAPKPAAQDEIQNENTLTASQEIKIQLFKYLLKHLKKNYMAIPEVSIGKAVIDMLVINGEIHAYEIKSKSDSLKRLEEQIETYKKHANRVTVVADIKFKDKLLSLEYMRDIGLIFTDENLKFNIYREAKELEITKENYFSYWSPIELKESLKGIKNYSKYNTMEAYKKILDLLNHNQTRRLTLYRLKQKYGEEFNNRKIAIDSKDFKSFFEARFHTKLKTLEVTPIMEIPFKVFADFN